jgi:ribosomal protein L40E
MTTTPSTRREYQNSWWRLECKRRLKEHLCLKCKTPIPTTQQSCDKCTTHRNLRTYERMVRDKILVLTNYSPNKILGCSWPGCKVKDLDMLVLDHIDGGGAEHRRSLKGSAKVVRVRRDLILRGFPPGYQTLCSSHNLKKEMVLHRQARDVQY